MTWQRRLIHGGDPQITSDGSVGPNQQHQHPQQAHYGLLIWLGHLMELLSQCSTTTPPLEGC